MAPICSERLAGARELPQNGRLVVKHTFLEVVETPVHEATLQGGATFLYKRASSDSALFDTCAQEEARCNEMLQQHQQQQHQQQQAATAATVAAAAAHGVGQEEEEEPTFELTGLSDADDDEAEEAVGGSLGGSSSGGDAALLLDVDTPLIRGCSGATSATTAVSSRAPSDIAASTTPPLPAEAEVGPRSSLDQLLSDNARLMLENKLLRENMRLAQEIQEMKQQAAAQAEELLGGGCGGLAPAMDFGGADFGAAVGQPWCVVAPAACQRPQAPQPARLSPPPPSGRGAAARPRGGAKASADVCGGLGGGAPSDNPTTVMLRNLPNNYTRAMVLAMLDEEGFQGLYNFLYLPIDFNSRACLGYAFINLVDPTVVQAFWETFDGYCKWILPSRKVCRVSWSGPHQGLDAHVNRYKNSPVMHESVPDEFKPVLFQDGLRVVFPAPTKAPRAPRVRHREATLRADPRR